MSVPRLSLETGEPTRQQRRAAERAAELRRYHTGASRAHVVGNRATRRRAGQPIVITGHLGQRDARGVALGVLALRGGAR